MRMRWGIAAAAGLGCALAVAGVPASAANKSIAAVAFTDWNPPDVTIEAGDDVTWTNATGFDHNVCVAAAGVSSGCDEYRSGDPSATWPDGGYTHRFAAAGSYTYVCQVHANMTGTITVQPASTGTSTTPPPDSQPTDTATVPTQTETTPVADTTAPGFTGKPKRRASRKSLVVELGSSEDATLQATVFRRPPRGRSFARVSQASVHVKAGKNVVKIPRTTVRNGAYRVKLQLVDAAGNKSSAKTLTFKVA